MRGTNPISRGGHQRRRRPPVVGGGHGAPRLVSPFLAAQEVFDSLVVLAAGSWTPDAIANGWQQVQRLQHTMDEGRQRRLEFIGFPADEAAEISALHTRNFM